MKWRFAQFGARDFDFNAKHCHERLKADHGWTYSYTFTKGQVQKPGRLKAGRRRAPRAPFMAPSSRVAVRFGPDPPYTPATLST
ncbi:hypothetical protein [Rhodospira trueperi]|uniref:Uncharacterized protein n=1 Tax=Rhodospira trueperi TaxID=69960 RepID=A0A1G7FDL7_9PROT|nr:hypothetical protein [Rhodospira trueperi]SDE73645.1 hypothetical protein SAMN05421720_1119 [Rhodospira trueperi]